MNESISIACVGDVMCGDSFYNLGCGCASSIKRYGVEFLDTKIQMFFHEHDIVLGNMESPVSDRGKNAYSLRSLHMRASSSVAPLLSQWGFTVMNVANNHILEHGLNAAKETVENLTNAGIVVIGDGGGLFQNGIKAKKIKARDHTITFLAFCLRNEKYSFHGGGEFDQILNHISESSSDGPVIVSVHWGDEFIDRPSGEIRSLGRMMIDRGAALVIGHHPHIMQGIEQYKGGLIAYSLGNFIFDSFEPECRWSVILSIKIDKNRNLEWRYLPVILDSEYRPCFAKEDCKESILKEMQRRCDLLKGDTDVLYQKQVKEHEKRFRLHLKKHLIHNFKLISPIFWPQILLRPIQRRLRIW